MKILRLPKAVWPAVFAVAAPMFAWAAFTTDSPTFLSENIPSSRYPAAQFYVDHKCAFWYPILGYPTP